MTAADVKSAFFGTNAIGDDRYTGTGGLGNIISDVLPNALVFSAFILFLYLIFGGFIIITASGNAKKADEGKQAVTNAIIGFIVIFTSYWIIQIIEIITGIPILKGS